MSVVTKKWMVFNQSLFFQMCTRLWKTMFQFSRVILVWTFAAWFLFAQNAYNFPVLMICWKYSSNTQGLIIMAGQECCYMGVKKNIYTIHSQCKSDLE